MSSLFYFRHFILRQGSAPMKAGTDSMILGSIVPVDGAARILDIGTGTGMLALMMAQRSAAQVHALEINGEACAEAGENFARSMWSRRLHIFHSSLQDFAPPDEAKYELIICNPPYFPPHASPRSSPGSAPRKHARQKELLSFPDLARHAARLLSEAGAFHVILPAGFSDEFTGVAALAGLHMHHRVLIASRPGTVPVRVISSFGFDNKTPSATSFTIYSPRGAYSEQYIHLTESFHAINLQAPVE